MTNTLQTTATTALQQQNGADMNALYSSFIGYLDASPKTVETYRKALKQFFNFLQERGIDFPQRADVLSYKDILSKGGYKPTTIQNYITAVKVFFNWTSQEGFYPNISEHIKGAKLDHEFKKDYFSTDQIKELRESIETDDLKGLRDSAIFQVMSNMALRDIEVCRLNVEDLRTRGGNSVLFLQRKGHEEKTAYPIPAGTEKAIREYLKARGKYKETDPLFISLSNHANGARLTTRSISRLIKNIFIDNGFNSSRLTAHSLRHSGATNALKAGMPLYEVQQFMGHMSPATTDIYNHAIQRENNACAKTLEDLYN